MLISETFRIALSSIRSNLFRATLTMLGIIIGVGAVITMVARNRLLRIDDSAIRNVSDISMGD